MAHPPLRLPSASSTCLCCCVADAEARTVAVGTEDGALAWFDVEAGTQVCRIDLQPHASSTSGSDGSTDAAVTSCTSCLEAAPGVVYAACGTSVHVMDLRAGTAPVHSFSQCCQEEVNQVCANRKASHLACADDAGDVVVLDLAAGKPFKRLRQAHSNMATCVAFRPHRPWELLSGGMDMTIARWDFAMGKCLGRWNLQQQQTQAGAGEQQLFNPPFVHALAVPPLPASAPRHWCQLAAVAAGNGSLVLFDADQGITTPDASADSGSGAGGGGGGAVGGGGKAGGSKAGSSKQAAAAAAQQQRGGGKQAGSEPQQQQEQQPGSGGQAQDDMSSGTLWWSDGASGGQGVEKRGGQRAAASAVAGVATRVWGQACGGHKRPASCLAFAWCGSREPGGEASRSKSSAQPSHLVSAGDDRRLLLWSLQGHGGSGGGAGSSSGGQAGEGKQELQPAAPQVEVAHGRKVNCLATCMPSKSSGGKSVLFVCDTSKRVSVYDLQALCLTATSEG